MMLTSYNAQITSQAEYFFYRFRCKQMSGIDWEQTHYYTKPLTILVECIYFLVTKLKSCGSLLYPAPACHTVNLLQRHWPLAVEKWQ